MAQSVIEELTSELSEITLSNAEANENPEFLNLFEKICCNKQKMIDCNEHFLTPSLLSKLKSNLSSGDQNVIYSTLCFIAALNRYDNSRVYMSNVEIIRLILSHTDGKNINILIQACRALGNACYENRKAQNLIADEGGLDIIVHLLEQATMADKPQNNRKFHRVIIGLILNLIADNQSVQLQMAGKNIVPYLTKLLKVVMENPGYTILSNNVFLAFVSLGEAAPIDLIFTEEFCRALIEMFKKAYKYESCNAVLDFLEDNELPDLIKLHFAKAGIMDVFMEILENKPETLTEDESYRYEQMGRVLANILSGDNAMEYLYELDNNKILSRFVDWLLSDDRDIVQIAILCIGNIARTDRHSVSIVEKDIHKHLLGIVKECTDDVKILYAAVSTLRNLCIPRENKVQLVKHNILETLLPLLEAEVETSPVIYKMVGTLRQLIDGQKDVAIKLGTDKKLIKQLVKWSSSCLHPSVSSECSRLMCWMVIVSRDREVISNILRNRGFPQIVRMLGALHGLMQSEALNAMIISASEALMEPNPKDNVPKDESDTSVTAFNFESMLLVCDLGDKLRHLLLQHGARMEEHILEEVFAFLEVITKFGRVVAQLKEEGLKQIFHSVMLSRNDFQVYKERIEFIEGSF